MTAYSADLARDVSALCDAHGPAPILAALAADLRERAALIYDEIAEQRLLRLADDIDALDESEEAPERSKRPAVAGADDLSPEEEAELRRAISRGEACHSCGRDLFGVVRESRVLCDVCSDACREADEPDDGDEDIHPGDHEYYRRS